MDRKALVIYRSKSGYAEQYARWIAEASGADLMEAKKAKSIFTLMPYDTIVYGAGLYMDRINGVKLITDRMEVFLNKNIIIFAVGMAPKGPGVINQIVEKNFSDDVWANIHFHLFRGGFDIKRCTPVDKLLMMGMKFHLKGQKSLSESDRDLLEGFEHPVDFRDKEAIRPLLEQMGVSSAEHANAQE